MLLSTQTDILGRRFGDEQAVRMLAAAGFDAVDYSMFGMVDPAHLLRSDEAEAHMAKLLDTAKECGVVFNQAHAPFSFGHLDEEGLKKEFFPTTVRSLELASRLGVKIIVVHPIHNIPYFGNEERLYEMNMKFYRALIPYCEAYGIKVATENMWKRDKLRGYILDDVCSRAKEFCRYLDDIGSEWIVGCLDLGHCGLVGVEAQDMIREMGGEHIHALHVHDNDYLSDAHTEPYSGKMDWMEITRALGEVNYRGDFTFEADNLFGNKSDAFVPVAAKYLHDIGRFMIGQIENARP